MTETNRMHLGIPQSDSSLAISRPKIRNRLIQINPGRALGIVYWPVAFGNGAAAGAFLTERIPAVTLGIPAAALLMVLLLCETSPAADASPHERGTV